MSTIRDAFLSEEDLDLKNLTDAELDAVWTAWLEQAQTTNEWDRDSYSHGVFPREPPWTRDDWPATGVKVGTEKHYREDAFESFSIRKCGRKVSCRSSTIPTFHYSMGCF